MFKGAPRGSAAHRESALPQSNSRPRRAVPRSSARSSPGPIAARPAARSISRNSCAFDGFGCDTPTSCTNVSPASSRPANDSFLSGSPGIVSHPSGRLFFEPDAHHRPHRMPAAEQRFDQPPAHEACSVRHKHVTGRRFVAESRQGRRRHTRAAHHRRGNVRPAEPAVKRSKR